MAVMRVFCYAVGDLDGKPVEAGSVTSARSITCASDLKYEKVVELAASSSAECLFDTTYDLDDFDFLMIESDQNVLLEFNTNGDTEYFTFELPGSGTANQYGLPFMLGSDDTILAGYQHTFAGATADTIEKIYAYNESTTTAARVHILAMT